MIQQLIEKIQKTKASICVGLDPMSSYIPEHIVKKSFHEFGETLEGATGAIWQFNKEIVDHIFNLVPSVKPQITIYEQFGLEGLAVYQKMVKHCQEKSLVVIGDIKRGDIGSTSAAYAIDHIGHAQVGNNNFAGSDAEFITMNPYLGTDGMRPFVDVCSKEDRSLFILVKILNPSSGKLRDRLVDGRSLCELIVGKAVEWGGVSMDGAYSNVGAAVGATYPGTSRILGELMPNAYFLMPGYGAQGGAAEDLKYCFDRDDLGVIMNSSGGIIAACKQRKYTKFGAEHFVEASRRAVMNIVADIDSVL